MSPNCTKTIGGQFYVPKGGVRRIVQSPHLELILQFDLVYYKHSTLKKGFELGKKSLSL